MVAAVLALAAAAAGADDIVLDGNSPGRGFEGVGALSAGASSRLLLDYPEPQRSQVLDFLFKPQFGAALHHLKVEIGGDINSTDGVEPSYARTRDEFDRPRPECFQRGYEWWLMREAKKRNPHIFIDVLQWGAPHWIGDRDFPDAGDPNLLPWNERMARNARKFYTQDNADFIVGFIKAARQRHGVDVDYCGVWNETMYDAGWIKLLRNTLDRHGLQRIKIVAADEFMDIWAIGKPLAADAELNRAVYAVGVHYPGCCGGDNHGNPLYDAAAARQVRQSGKPIWASEDGPWAGDWPAAGTLAKTFNRNYVLGRMVKTVIWSLVSSYYENLPCPNSGPMKANAPWSGHYEVQPGVWALAHTTQFAQPGWRYLDGACRLLSGGGSCVCLRSPDARGDYSLIIETIDAQRPQKAAFSVAGGLAGGPLHVWRTNKQRSFERLDDVAVQGNAFALELAPGCIYSLTTTTGQCKGTADVPPPGDFPLPYADDFENGRPGQMPRYFSDQGGVFELAARPDGGGCLQQTIALRGIDWHGHQNPEPYSMIGSPAWRDYGVECDVRIARSGYVSLFGRIVASPQSAEPPKGYGLYVAADGHWRLKAFTKTLAEGRAPFSADSWHRLRLDFSGTTISVAIDGAAVQSLTDATFASGMAGVGSGWNRALFDNFHVHSASRPTGEREK